MSHPVRRRSNVLTLIALAALSSFFAATANATSYVVSATSPACKSGFQFTSIGAAISTVPGGSTIYICPGTYAEQLKITKPLTLTGVAANGLSNASASGANNPVIAAPAGGVLVNTSDLSPYGDPNQPTAAQILVQTPTTNPVTPTIVVNISNLTVDGSNNQLNSCATDLVGIYYQNASGTVDHVTARYQELSQSLFGCQDGLAIYVQSGYATAGTAAVTIENSNVHDYDKNGITADGGGTVVTINSNYVVGIGPTPLIAQNGIQLSDGASGTIESNTVTDDVYVNPSNCYDSGDPQDSSCYSATGILLYDSGGTNSSHVAVKTNTLSNTQGAIVAYTDGTATAYYAGTADYNDVTSNKVTTNAAIVVTGNTYLLDGIDLCSDNNTATTNVVSNSSGAGVHLDSSCSEPGGNPTGTASSATRNTVNEACAGVLTGNSGTASGNVTYNVAETTYAGDSCPAGAVADFRTKGKMRLRPRRH